MQLHQCFEFLNLELKTVVRLRYKVQCFLRLNRRDRLFVRCNQPLSIRYIQSRLTSNCV